MLSDRELQIAANKALYEDLEDQGDSRTQVREIDHLAMFASLEARNNFIEHCLVAGFFLRATIDPFSPSGAYRAQIWHRDIPSEEAMDQIAPFVSELAYEAGGDYEGWCTRALV